MHHLLRARVSPSEQHFLCHPLDQYCTWHIPLLYTKTQHYLRDRVVPAQVSEESQKALNSNVTSTSVEGVKGDFSRKGRQNVLARGRFIVCTLQVYRPHYSPLHPQQAPQGCKARWRERAVMRLSAKA